MTEHTLCHDKLVPWMTLAEMNAELTDLFCSNLASSIVSLYGIYFWTNMGYVFPIQIDQGPRRPSSRVMADFAAQGNMLSATIPFLC